MIAQQSTSLQSLTRTEITQTWRAPVSRSALAAIGTRALGLSRTLIGWVRDGAMPHATLWEASLTVDMLTERDTPTPDAYSTVTRFATTDAWLNG